MKLSMWFVSALIVGGLLAALSGCSVNRTGVFEKSEVLDAEGNIATYEQTEVTLHDVTCTGSCAVKNPGKEYTDITFAGPSLLK